MRAVSRRAGGKGWVGRRKTAVEQGEKEDLRKVVPKMGTVSLLMFTFLSFSTFFRLVHFVPFFPFSLFSPWLHVFFFHFFPLPPFSVFTCVRFHEFRSHFFHFPPIT